MELMGLPLLQGRVVASGRTNAFFHTGQEDFVCNAVNWTSKGASSPVIASFDSSMLAGFDTLTYVSPIELVANPGESIQLPLTTIVTHTA